MDRDYVIALPCADVQDRACVEECPVDLGWPGGAAALGGPGADGPLIAALPPPRTETGP